LRKPHYWWLLALPRTRTRYRWRQGCQFGFFEASFRNSGFFWTPLAFFEHLWLFLEIKKILTNSGFFCSPKGLTLKKHCLSCVFITNLFWKECITISGCTKYWKYFTYSFTISLKMINAIDKKQMYDNVIMGKENASKECNCCIINHTDVSDEFWCLFCVWFCIFFFCRLYALKLVSGFFWDKKEKGLAFFGEDKDRLGTLVEGAMHIFSTLV